MYKRLIPAAAALMLAGCGLADVGAAGASAGTSAVEQAKQAKEIEARAQQRVDAAVKQAEEQRKAAEDTAQ
jgi:hypothetical protein